MQPRISKKVFLLVTAVLIFITICLALFWNIIPPKKASTYSNRQLRITAVTNEEAGITTISSEQLGECFTNGITIYDLSDVNIEIEDSVYPLEEAFLNNLISIEEIFYYARVDSKNGFCTENYISENGLAHFIYTYPEFDLQLIYDVYETPDGSKHLINEIGFYKIGSTISKHYIDKETGDRLDKENWGLIFEVVENTHEGLTISCTQSGGQQIGELILDFYDLYDATTNSFIPLQAGVLSIKQYQHDIVIPKDDTTTITIDWTQVYGTVSNGNYYILLNIRDEFDHDMLHPLMKNFYNIQTYRIDFSIS